MKKSYRDRLRDPNVVFVHLSGSKEQIGRRLAARNGHFMPVSLLDSQFAALEPPTTDEQRLVVDVMRAPAEVGADIIGRLGLHHSADLVPVSQAG